MTISGWFRKGRDGRSESVSRAATSEVGAVDVTGLRLSGATSEGVDRLFEGGGAVLLAPSFWEKAGWGVAILTAMAPCLG